MILLFGAVFMFACDDSGNEPLPWSISFKAIFKLGDALTFKAESGDEGEMTAQILIDDEAVTSETATFLIQLDYIKGLK